MNATASPAGMRVPPSLARGIGIAVLYMAVFLVAALVSGVDYDALSDSTSNVVGFVIIPVGLATIVTLAVTARWGWWHALFHEDEKLDRPGWRWLVPGFMLATILVTLIASPWHEFSTGLVLLILVGTMMVGFAEEIIFRGYVLLGARSRYTEVGAWFCSSAVFGLFHGVNVVFGQAIGTTVQQVVVAFVFGSGLYFIRRMTGLLAVGMVVHGLWDFSTFIGAGRGESTDAISNTVAATPFQFAAIISIIALLIVTFRRRGGSDAPAPAAS